MKILHYFRYWLVVLGLIALAFICGCSRKTVVQPGINTTTKDSVVYKVIPTYRDTTIFLPGDSVTLYDTLFLQQLCPDAPKPAKPYTRSLQSGSGRSTLQVSVDSGGRLKVNCKADSLQLELDSALKEVSHITELYSKSTTTITVPVPGPTVTKYRTRKWIWWLLLASLGLNAWHYRRGIIGLITSKMHR